MTNSTVTYHELKLSLPDDWEVADEDDADAPLTLVKPEGVGALQFSTAVYVGGELPRITLSELEEMLNEFAEEHELGDPGDTVRIEGPLLVVGATYEAGGDCVRAWYVSDSVNAAFATYNCAIEDRNEELVESEAIVKSVWFTP